MTAPVFVPIYIANTNPFRLVLRDGDDSWQASLEQINNSKYDYVKLHRATKFFDAEIAKPFPLCVGFDGSFILPAVKQYSTLEATLDEFNRIFASILIGGVYIEGVTPSDLSHGEMTMYGYYRHIKTFGGKGELHKALGNRDAGSYESICLHEPHTILASEIESAYTEGAKIIKTVKNLSPSLFISAFTHFIKHQTREALTSAWISIEQTIDHIWQKVVIEDAKKINIQNRRKFLDSQQWTSAHKIELLFQRTIFHSSSYEHLSIARSARNDFIHKGLPPNQIQVENALKALIDLLYIAAKLEQLELQKSHLERYLVAGNFVGSAVAAAEKVDWSQVKAWKEIPTIPGDPKWSGNFEKFEDITLQPIKPGEIDG